MQSNFIVLREGHQHSSMREGFESLDLSRPDACAYLIELCTRSLNNRSNRKENPNGSEGD